MPSMARSSERSPSAAKSQPLPRFAARTPSREVTGAVAAMALHAGQSVGLVNEIKDAAQVVGELAEEAERLLQRWDGEHRAPTTAQAASGTR
jgi:hypothetical protein